MGISLRKTVSSLAAPTPREILLLALLLVLLLISSSNIKNNVDSKELQKQFFSTVNRDRPPHLNSDSANTPKVYETQLSWGKSRRVPATIVVAHVPGWTIFDRLYFLNGTLYVVSDEPESIPPRRMMISTAVPIQNGPIGEAKRVPTDKEMSIVSTDTAKELFGVGAERLDGVTWLVNDPGQFITHYYHWSAELFFGFWRTYSSLDPAIDDNGNTTLPTPRRMLFTHITANHWRDYADMNQLVLRTSFPSISMEFKTDWEERADMARPFVFDRVVVADRAAAMNGKSWQRTQRTASEPFALTGSAHWWSTIRNNVVRFAGSEPSRGSMGIPVITYVSRQEWGRRMLIQADHNKLVRELYNLRDTYGYEVNVVNMDKLSRMEQLRLAAKTTIMMGVHGNGLTSLIWMKPTPRSTVIEFFYPEGFAHDYEWTTRALGMVHYGFWNDKSFTSPEIPPVNYPDGFQGDQIPIDGAAVARLCHRRLTLEDEADD